MITGLKRLWSALVGLRDSEGAQIILPGPPAAPDAHSDTCRRVAPGTPAILVQFDLAFGLLNVVFAALYPPNKISNTFLPTLASVIYFCLQLLRYGWTDA